MPFLSKAASRNEHNCSEPAASRSPTRGVHTCVIPRLLPRSISGYMYHVTNAIVSSASWHHSDGGSAANRELLQTLTKPLTKLIIQV